VGHGKVINRRSGREYSTGYLVVLETVKEPSQNPQQRVTRFFYYASMSPFMILILVSLATHRISRVVTRDLFPPVYKLRLWIDCKLGSDHWFAYLTQCDWCTSVWVSAFLSGGLAAYSECLVPTPWIPWGVWLLIAPAGASVAGLIAQREPESDES
jgi:hypothetical protein